MESWINLCKGVAADLNQAKEPLVKLRRALSGQDEDVISSVLDLGIIDLLVKVIKSCGMHAV